MRRPLRGAYHAVLFDLDGTVIDSAPDLAGAANELRQQRGLPALPLETLRPWVGAGARGMVWAALEVDPSQPEFNALRDEFLTRYEQRMTALTQVFDAMHPLLMALNQAQVPWGIVTNKAARFALPLVRALQLDRHAATVVCGDTTPHAKPHPAPLLEAARQLDLPPQSCVYVGDDLRDIQAGEAAGMGTVSAGWGYLGLGEEVEGWGANFMASSPTELQKWLELI